MMNDLISRAELFNRLANVQDMAKAYAVIQDMPTVEERKKGKWIKGIDVPNRNPYFHLADVMYCSECLNEAYWDTDYGQQLFDYCPYCGADMRGEGNG